MIEHIYLSKLNHHFSYLWNNKFVGHFCKIACYSNKYNAICSRKLRVKNKNARLFSGFTMIVSSLIAENFPLCYRQILHVAQECPISQRASGNIHDRIMICVKDLVDIVPCRRTSPAPLDWKWGICKIPNGTLGKYWWAFLFNSVFYISPLCRWHILTYYINNILRIKFLQRFKWYRHIW